MKVPEWVNIAGAGWGTYNSAKRKDLRNEKSSEGQQGDAAAASDDEFASLCSDGLVKKRDSYAPKSGDGKSSEKTQQQRNGALLAFTRTWDLELLKRRNGLSSQPDGEPKKASGEKSGDSNATGKASPASNNDKETSGSSIIKRFQEASSFSYDHSVRVGTLAGDLARKMESAARRFPEGTLSKFYNDLGKFHDIGKYSIPYEILEKPGGLTPEETKLVRNHPIVGEGMLKGNEEFRNLLPAVRHHHERWDGNGYPDKLKGTNIPLEARIISIADSYDAMISDRPYRKGRSSSEAIDELKRCAGTQFDPRLVGLFSQMINEQSSAG